MQAPPSISETLAALGNASAPHEVVSAVREATLAKTFAAQILSVLWEIADLQHTCWLMLIEMPFLKGSTKIIFVREGLRSWRVYMQTHGSGTDKHLFGRSFYSRSADKNRRMPS